LNLGFWQARFRRVSTTLLPILAWLAAASLPIRDSGAQERAQAPDQKAAPAVAPPARDDGWVTVDRGERFDALRIPRDERLEFEVSVDTFLGDISAGKVTLSSGTEPYNAGLPFAGAPGESGSPKAPGAPGSAPKANPQLVGWIKSVAEGSYLGYTLHHELEARHLPQAWPSTIYTDRQSGSENRQRELKIGLLEGKPTLVYRSDGHCNGCSNPQHFIESAWVWGKPHHCPKCKRAEHRVWDPPETRAIPPGTVDLLTAVYLARELVHEGRTSSTFPVLDRLRLWNVTVQRGETKSIEVPSGTFRCSSVQLKTAVPPTETPDKDGFSGLFGIRGTIKIWFEEKTGVPVMISGELPVPVIKHLDVNVKLAAHHGTPPEFQPIPTTASDGK
jgi:hypothetical protein